MVNAAGNTPGGPETHEGRRTAPALDIDAGPLLSARRRGAPVPV